MSENRFVISPPLYAQGLEFAAQIRRHYPGVQLMAGLLPKKHRARSNLRYLLTRYHGAVELSPAKTANSAGSVVIPCSATATAHLFKSCDAIQVGEITLARATQVWMDKTVGYGMAQSAGVPCPATVDNPTQATFPCFVKSRHELGRRERQILQHPHEAKPLAGRDDLIYQELIRSTSTFGVAFLARDGALLASHQHEETVSLPRTGGSAAILRDIHHALLADYTARLVRASRYSGWGLAEFKWCPTRKDFVFLEINAKFWASIRFTFRQEPAFGRLLVHPEFQPLSRCPKGMVFVDRLLASSPRTFFSVDQMAGMTFSRTERLSFWPKIWKHWFRSATQA